VNLYYLFRILHLVSMAAWLGAAMWVASDLKRTLELGAPHTSVVGARVRPALKVDVWAGVATMVTGVVLAGLGKSHRIGVAVGFAIALVLFILVMTVILPAGKRAAAEAEAGRLDEARRLTKSVAAFSGVGHLLWLAALVAMVLPY
jgi:hypothetical protein